MSTTQTISISRKVWNKYTPEQQGFFQYCIPSGRGTQSIKNFVRDSFQFTDHPQVVKFGVINVDGQRFVWSETTNQFYPVTTN